MSCMTREQILSPRPLWPREVNRRCSARERPGDGRTRKTSIVAHTGKCVTQHMELKTVHATSSKFMADKKLIH